ncbi:MAG: hypothetical protein HBSIN02_22710 [Bacteroidia bacterium]|nr:MAG: hypothetical protein HBSIN02_22710 [Bacteroidia bacterium]
MTEKKTQRERSAGKSIEPAPAIPERLQTPAAIAMLLVSLVMFFQEVIFQPKSFYSPDTVASMSFQTLIRDAEEQGIFPLWNPYIFCGMPGYASATVHGTRTFDVTAFLLQRTSGIFQWLLLETDIGWVLLYYALFAIGMYFLILHLIGSRLAALFGAMAALFSTTFIVWIMAGHMTKMPVLAFFPFIFLLADRLRTRFRWTEALLLVLAVHYLFLPAHAQMIFYAYCALGVYYVFFIVRALRRKEEWKGWIRSALTVAGATVVALMMTADTYLSTWEYLPYSIRGASPITASSTNTASGALDYDYATNWSFPPAEIMTLLVPSWFGFGTTTYEGVLTQGNPQPLNTYFGKQPFVETPPYMGLPVMLLAVLAMILLRREPFVQFLTILSILAFLVSFGREFPILYDPMFAIVPFFNKFRAPSMVLALVHVAFPILAAFFAARVMQSKELILDNLKRWRWSLVALAALLLLTFLGKGLVRGVYGIFFSPQDVGSRLARSYGPLPPGVLEELYSYVVSLVQSDLAIGFLSLLAILGGLVYFAQRKIGYSVLTILVLGATLLDLWHVNYRPLKPVDRRVGEQLFTAPEYVKYLLQDTTAYRVLEFIDGQPPYNNSLAYWRIQSAYGYQGAKMRAYQDMIDVVGLRNPVLWQLMNVKYIISNRPDTTSYLGLAYDGPDRKVYVNRLVYPRAFFVSRLEVADARTILERIARASFNPRSVAYVLEDPGVSLDPLLPTNTVEITHWGIQDLSLSVTAGGRNLLFLSETWYPEGWKAYVDGEEAPILRLNYLFRGIVVPPGEHTITLRFEPRGFAVGKQLSLWANLLVLGSLIGLGAATAYKQRFRGT